MFGTKALPSNTPGTKSPPKKDQSPKNSSTGNPHQPLFSTTSQGASTDSRNFKGTPSAFNPGQSYTSSFGVLSATSSNLPGSSVFGSVKPSGFSGFGSTNNTSSTSGFFGSSKPATTNPSEPLKPSSIDWLRFPMGSGSLFGSSKPDTRSSPSSSKQGTGDPSGSSKPDTEKKEGDYKNQ